MWARGLLTEGYEEGAKMQPGLGLASCTSWWLAASSENQLHLLILTQALCGPAETKPGFSDKGSWDFESPKLPILDTKRETFHDSDHRVLL